MEDTIKNPDYDSTKDATLHRLNIRNVMELIVIPELYKRMEEHDLSKYEEPEKSCYDKYIPELKKHKYGTDEYNEVREEMAKTGLAHHYKVNRHHPEHFPHGVNDMTLVDLVELICDWFAASLVSDTTFISGLPLNAKRTDMPDMLKSIITNTYREYFKDFEALSKGKKIDQDYINELKLRVYEMAQHGCFSDTERDAAISRINNMIKDKK